MEKALIFLLFHPTLYFLINISEFG